MELEAEDSGVLLTPAGENSVTEVIGYMVVVADNAASANPVAEATAQLESAGLEVPKALPQSRPAAAEKAPLADNEYDIVVCAPAGYYSAIVSTTCGKVAIIEKSEFGGTCLE